MALSGTFTTMPFPDLLQWLGEARRSGALAISQAFEERYIRLEDGTITGLGASDPRLSDLAPLVLARGLIDEAVLQRVLGERERSGRSLRTILIDDGHVAKPALAEATRAHAKDVVLRVFLWDDAQFVLYNDNEPTLLAPEHWDLIVDPPIPITAVLMEAMRRIDEWKRIAEVFPSDYTVVHAIGSAGALPALRSLAAIGAPTALGDLCMQLARPRFEILEELYQAWKQGLLAVAGTSQELARPDRAAPTEQLLEAGKTLLAARQFDEAAALIRSALSLDPMNRAARQLLDKAQADQLDDLYRQFPPYRVPRVIIDRDHGDALPLTSRERYLLSRINGRWDVAGLTVMTPLGEVETLRALRKLHHVHAIELG